MNTQQLAGVAPPGTHLKREIDSRGWSQADLAEILGRPIQAVNQIVKGKKAVTPATARDLEGAMGIAAQLWLNLESQYRLSLEAARDESVTCRAELFSRAPVGDMRRRGWIRDTRDVRVLTAEVLRFLRIESLAEPPHLRFAARKSTEYGTVTPEQEAWSCRALRLAEEIRGVRPFSRRRFEQGLRTIRGLAASVESVSRIPAALADLGIRFVVVEHLPRTKIDGATFWLGRSRPVVALSLRYGRIDYFLFTLFHELSHVRHEDALSIDSDLLAGGDGNEAAQECEARANREAASVLVPPREMAEFVGRGRFGKPSILRFATTIGVHPAVVLGQLQHRGAVGWSACRELLVPIREAVVRTAVTDGWDGIKDG